ncbi:MAG: plastocyanin/azurin family copper-binding protein [Acidimicrobiia bacterium]|nr:plastocyanin/azurin family copper-binding protein [Acidimicrobiia bacterium]
MKTSNSSIPTHPLGRRRFIAAIGGGAAAAGLVACGDDGPESSAAAGAAAAGAAAATPTETAASGATDATAGDAATESSSAPAGTAAVDTRSVSIIPALTRIDELQPADDSEVRMAYAPAVPAVADRNDQRIVEFEIDVIEGECPIDPENGVDTLMWGFRIGGDDSVTCGSPGPVMRARVGDLARITVNNMVGNLQAHNIDFHSVTGQGGGAADTTVAPGESATINCRLLYPGAFMYHCAYGDVPKHIAHGMYGMFIVDPEDPLPTVDHEWSVMQSEWYLADGVDADPEAAPGAPSFDPDRMLLEHPTYVTFNGRTDALVGDNALQMEVGQRARIYMVNEGLNLTSNFHPIGSHWDVVYPEAATHPVNRVIRGSQSTLVVAGGGTVTELLGQVPSTILLVDHALVRTFYKGAVGQVVVSGEANAIFSAGDDGLEDAAANEPATATPDVAPDAVLIPEGAFDPSNAENAYVPLLRTVAVGTTVTWTNEDTVIHTATSGSSNGSVGTPDGVFDSGDILPGDSFAFTFEEAGTFDYYCTPHPWMKAQVEVTG